MLSDAFDAAERAITAEDLLRNIHASVPLSRTMKEQIDDLRFWASTRARNTSTPAAEAPVQVEVMEPRETAPALRE